jgi:hypothetical protein
MKNEMASVMLTHANIQGREGGREGGKEGLLLLNLDCPG